MKTSIKIAALVILSVVSTATVSAQSAKEISQKGIVARHIYQQDIEDGEKEATLWKEEWYNEKGDILETKEYDDNGKTVGVWLKYRYDKDGNLVEYIECDGKGNTKNRYVDTFVNGYRTERVFYDSKGRITKKRTYKYDLKK